MGADGADPAVANVGESILRVVSLHQRITFDPTRCGGRPCIRNTRVRVSDIPDLFADGLSADQILDELPYLEREDLSAALEYALRSVDHPILAV